MAYTPGNVILVLKILVAAVTVLVIVSLVALALGKKKLHGRMNIIMFVLTMLTLVGFEVIIKIVSPGMIRNYFTENDQMQILYIHLCFAIPAALFLLVQFFTGILKRYKIHRITGILFLIFWTGTFITGIFFLPHHN